LRSTATVLENLSSGSTVLSPDRERVVSFDREGRWLFYFRRGETFKRSLASEVHRRYRRRSTQRERLADSAVEELFGEVDELARELVTATSAEARRRLQTEVLRWTPETLAQERERFLSAYRPIAILPPDQYLAVVLQATEGCTWNGCTFCNFYMDRPLRLRSASDFRIHARRVEDLLGRGLRMRRGVFLADGNALALSNDRLDPLLDVAEEVFPGKSLFGFVDLYSGDRRTVSAWRHLAERGLERVYIGMETGSDELLEWVEKPGSASALEGFVKTLKEAGLQVSPILMVGLGGVEYRRRHREASLELLLRLPLDRNDLVYLSPFVEHQESRYRELRVAAGLTAMDEAAVEIELDSLAGRLRQGGLKVSRYDIREFVY